MPELLPFPRYFHPPSGITETLPVTRDGIRQMEPFPFVAQERENFATLSIRHGETGRSVHALCGLLPASDFHNGTVLPHERTLSARLERQQKLVTRDAGALGKPVLLTVPSLAEVAPRERVEDSEDQVVFYGDNHIYRLAPRRGDDRRPVPISGPLVIADGHHRAYTHAALAADGLAEFQYIPVVIAGADQLTIGTFLRLISPEGASLQEILAKIEPHFALTPLDRPRQVTTAGNWLFSYQGKHYHLKRRDASVSDTDPGWLNSVVLPDVFGITDSRTDPRIESVDPPAVVDGVVHFDPRHDDRIKFLGKPVSTESFFTEVEAGRTLPPKSTRFEPRVPSGLLVWIP